MTEPATVQPRSGRPHGLAVVGPTAVGKSELAVRLAIVLGGEVVNADAMQLYRGMDVGTAKLRPAERLGVPHHLLDVLSVRDEASVAEYQQAASVAVEDIVGRGRLPILVGGSGLYVAAVVDRLQFPGTDPEIRASLEAELAEVGTQALHARLAERDPAAAAAILPSNSRRVVRALEVLELTGAPYPATLAIGGATDDVGTETDAGSGWLRLGLTAPRDELDARIEARVDRMWAAGLVDEVRALVGSGLREGRTASRALGYAQVLQMLDGEYDEASARAQVVAGTRRLVRRQESWFRRDRRVRWVGYAGVDGLESVLAELGAAAASTTG
jgi:tRNA dimethylallyltransferase